MELLPTATLGLANPCGWMNSVLFMPAMKECIHHSRRASPTLLILDNHKSHLFAVTLNLAKDNGVIIVTLLPHCSNKLQSSDVSIFVLFKTYYNSAINSWMMRNSEIPVSIYQVALHLISQWLNRDLKMHCILIDIFLMKVIFLVSSITDREELQQDKRNT